MNLEITPTEARLVKAVASGEKIEFAASDEIRAEVVSTLCWGSREDWKISSAGIAIFGGRIVGLLDLANCHLSHPLLFQNVLLFDGIDLSNSHIRSVSVVNSKIGNGAFAIDARSVFIEGFIGLSASTIDGPFKLIGAKVVGQLVADQMTFRSFVGPALDASGSSIAAIFLSESNFQGSVVLNRSQLEHDLSFINVEIRAHHHVAVGARGAVIKGSVYIQNNCKIDGAVHFGGSEITGSFRLTDSALTSATLARRRQDAPLAAISPDDDDEGTLRWINHALDLSEAKIGRVFFPPTSAARPLGIVDLSRAKVGTFTDFKASWPPSADRHTSSCLGRPRDENGRDADHLVLDGFEYEHLDNPDGLPDGEVGPVAEARINWLHAQSREDIFDRLRPQPWKHLAKILLAQGYEDDARNIAIERRVALRYAKGMRRTARFLSRVLHLLSDYGFNPWKSVAWSAILVLFFALLYFVPTWYRGDGRPLATNQRVFVRTLPADFVPAFANVEDAEKQLMLVYPRFDPLLYSLDVFLPLVDLGSERFWRPNTAHWLGVVLYYFSVIEGIVGALLLSLIVTGFTGLLTRDET